MREDRGGDMAEEKRDLGDIVLSWSVQEIMNDDLYKGKAKEGKKVTQTVYGRKVSCLGPGGLTGRTASAMIGGPIDKLGELSYDDQILTMKTVTTYGSAGHTGQHHLA